MFSCTFAMYEVYVIELYDENDKPITESTKLDELKITKIEDSKRKPYREFDIKPFNYGSEDAPNYGYKLIFYLGHSGHHCAINTVTYNFRKAKHYLGMKIEDTKEQYKPVDIYPLSNYEKGAHIKVRLEKK